MLVALLAACGGEAAVRSVEIQEDSLRMAPEDTAPLTAEVEVTGSVADDVDWESTNETVATVDEDGVVTAVAVGVATVRAISVADSTMSDSVTVTVIKPPSTDDVPAPGDTDGSLGGKPATVTKSYEDGEVGLAVEETHLLVGLQAPDGSELPVKDGDVPRVTEDGIFSLSGSGYEPGSNVDVWLFSDPVLLGTVLTGDDGSFTANYEMPEGTTVGSHTLVIQGNTADGKKLELRLGFQVESGEALAEFAHCPADTGWFVSVDGDDMNDGDTVWEPVASIQDAVDAASDGDVVCLAAGDYDAGFVIIEFDGLTVVGAGEATRIEPAQEIDTGIPHKYRPDTRVVSLIDSSTDVHLDGITFTTGDLAWSTDLDAIVFWNASSGEIANSRLIGPGATTGDQTGQGLAVDASSGETVDLTLTDTDFSGWNKNAIDVVNGHGSSVDGEGGTVVLNVKGGTYIGAGETAVLAQNGIMLWDRAGGEVSGTIDGVTMSDISYVGDKNAEAAAVLPYGGAKLATVKNSEFSESVQVYISNSTPHDIDATENNTFAGVLGSSADVEQLAAIEAKILDAADDVAFGEVAIQ